MSQFYIYFSYFCIFRAVDLILRKGTPSTIKKKRSLNQSSLSLKIIAGHFQTDPIRDSAKTAILKILKLEFSRMLARYQIGNLKSCVRMFFVSSNEVCRLSPYKDKQCALW